MTQVVLSGKGTFFIQCGQSGSLVSVNAIVGGTGYTNNTYTSVPLTGGHGTGAQATIVVSGNAVVSVTVTTSGSGYALGDTLSASNANLGGSGSGFASTVNAVGASGPVLWTRVDGGIFSSDAVADIAFLSSSAAAVVTTGGNAAYTTNSGSSWTYVAAPVGASTFNSVAAGNGVLIASAIISGTNTLCRSADGGATWSTITLPGNFSYNALPAAAGYSSVGGGNGFWYMFGNASFGTGLGIVVSTDNGVTWTTYTVAGLQSFIQNTIDETMQSVVSGGNLLVFGQSLIPAQSTVNSCASILETSNGTTWTLNYNAPPYFVDNTNSILAATAGLNGTFTVAGNQTTGGPTTIGFEVGGGFGVIGSAANDGTYYVQSLNFDGTNTEVTVTGTVPANNGGGHIASNVAAFFTSAVIGSTIYTAGGTYDRAATGQQTGEIVYSSTNGGGSWTQDLYSTDPTVPPWAAGLLLNYNSTLVTGYDPSDGVSLGTSTNGSTWIVNSSESSYNVGNGISQDSSTFYAFGSQIVGSTNLSTWTLDVDTGTGGINQIRYSGSTTIAVGVDSSGNGGIWLKP